MPDFDQSQRQVFGLSVKHHARVLGAAGTGKTRALVEAHVAQLSAEGWREEDVMALAPNRLAAASLKQQIEARAGVAMGGTAARTASSLAFSILARGAAVEGVEPPRLLTGTVQDEAIAEFLLTADVGLAFPPEVLVSPAFRGELRELWRVSDDYDLAPEELASRVLAAAEVGRSSADAEGPETGLAERWATALRFVAAIQSSLAVTRPGELSSSTLVREAVALVLAEGGVHEGAKLRLPRLVLVDDAQECGEGALALIAALAARGSTVWAFGDPDASTAAFQGEPSALAVHPERELVRRGGSSAARGAEQTVVLQQSHRHGPELRALIDDLSVRVGARGAGQQRRPAPAVSAGTATLAADAGTVLSETNMRAVRFTVAASTSEQLGVVAHQIRARKLGLDGSDPLEWSDMAVICRSRGEAVRAARALALHQVPTSLAAGGVVLREHQLVRDLVALLRHALGIKQLDAAHVLDLVGGPIGRLDPVARRRLRRELLLAERREAAAEGRDTKSIEERVFEAFSVPGAEPIVDSAGGRALRRIAVVAAAGALVFERGGTARETLWAIWDRTKLASKLQNEALDGKPARADEANRALDAVVALFFALQRHEEQASSQPVPELLNDLMANTLPEDSLARQTGQSTVTVTTPQGAIGREFAMVTVLGLQDGSWPNLRARGTLLGAAALERWLRGGQAQSPSRRDTIHDEMRLLVFSCSRAAGELLVVAVADEDQHPSAFYRFGKDYSVENLPSSRLTLRGQAAQMRRRLAHDAGDGQAVVTLAALARAGVSGAHPHEWYGVMPPSTERPLVDLDGDPEAVVRVSPSALERAEQCPLNWAIQSLGGGSGNAAADIGTLVHHAFETVAEPEVTELMSAVLSEWQKLPFDADWESERAKERAETMVSGLAKYLREFAASDRKLLGRETRFQVPVGRAVLSGMADRLEGITRADGVTEVTVLDLKTGKTPPTAKETEQHAQLLAYQVGVALGAFALGESGAGAESPDGVAGAEAAGSGASNSAEQGSGEYVTGGARLLYVHPDAAKTKGFVERSQQPLDAEQQEAFLERVSNAAQIMSGATFVARVEHHCSDPHAPGDCSIHVVPAVSRA